MRRLLDKVQDYTVRLVGRAGGTLSDSTAPTVKSPLYLVIVVPSTLWLRRMRRPRGSFPSSLGSKCVKQFAQHERRNEQTNRLDCAGCHLNPTSSTIHLDHHPLRLPPDPIFLGPKICRLPPKLIPLPGPLPEF